MVPARSLARSLTTTARTNERTTDRQAKQEELAAEKTQGLALREDLVKQKETKKEIAAVRAWRCWPRVMMNGVHGGVDVCVHGWACVREWGGVLSLDQGQRACRHAPLPPSV